MDFGDFAGLIAAYVAVVIPVTLYAVSRRDDRLKAIEQNMAILAERMGKLEGVIEGFIAGMKKTNS